MDDERETMEIPKTIVKKYNAFASNIQVLVVDNDPKSLKSLKGMLKESHYKVVAVDKAEKALDLLHRNEKVIDLLLVDANLPLMNGLDLLEAVKKKFNIPVLMMCSKNKINIAVRALKLGASFVFSKPIDKQSIQNMWQHVHDKHVKKIQPPKSSKKSYVESIEASSSSNNKVRGQLASSRAKIRIVWTPELHQKFLEAIHILGNDVFPEKILEVMNIKGLTRTHVASHLQKFRLSMKSNVVRRNRWNSPSGFYRGHFGFSYDPSAMYHKGPQSALVPNALYQQMPTALLPGNETNGLSPSGSMPQFGCLSHNFQGQLDNIFMNQGTLQNPIMINTGNTPQNFGSPSKYVITMMNDQAISEVFLSEEKFQNMSIQSQGVSPRLHILDSGDMDAFVTDTEGIQFDQAGTNYSNNEGSSNKEWTFLLDDVLFNEENANGDVKSMNLDGDINEDIMLNNRTDSNNTPIYEIGKEDMSNEENGSSTTNFNYSSDKGKSAMSLAGQTENGNSWLKIYNDATYISQQGNQTAREQHHDNSMEALVFEMQQGDDPMSAEDIDFLVHAFGDRNSAEI